MLAQIESLVGGVDHDAVLAQAQLVQRLQNTAHSIVHRGHAAEVILHVALVLPTDELLALQVRLEEGFVLRAVRGVPGLSLFLAHPPEEGVHEFCITLVLVTLDLQVVEEGHMGIYAHLVLTQYGCPVRVVVEEGLGFGDGNAVVLGQVFRAGHPVAVGGLVLAHEKEGFVLVLLGKKVERQVRGDFDRVPGDRFSALGRNVIGPVITTLARIDHPLIESGWVGSQVPFSENRSPIADLLQELGKSHLPGVETVAVSLEAVLVAVLARQDAGPAWPANGVGAEVRLKEGSLLGNPVDVRGLVDLGSISRDGLGRMIVREDEHDVGLGRLKGRAKEKQSQDRKAFRSPGLVLFIFHFSKGWV